ncbi:MAG: hypothetical protein HC890_12200 [Chloroflexaceae bacterium]|nr:hypothetical protein [Chloroflexaceae bacterium]
MGREETLWELHSLLMTEKSRAVCVVAGMGGVGKTELVLQYALRSAVAYPGGRCWLSVRGGNLGLEIVNFGRRLGIRVPDGLELREQVRFVWTQWPEELTLIVFDDVAKWEAIQEFQPPVESHFKVLLTSRNRKLGSKCAAAGFGGSLTGGGL